MSKGRILFSDDLDTTSKSQPEIQGKILFTDDEQPSEHPLKQFLKGTLNYDKGLGLGFLQGTGDVGASIGNFPADIYEHFSGKSPYHIPHPELQKYYPEGVSGKLGSMLGENIAPFAVPGGSALKAARAFNNPLMKALIGALAGGVTNAASHDEDRIGSGITGATLGATLPLAGSAAKGISNIPFTKGMASKSLKKAEELIGERNIKNIKVPKDIFKESKDFLPNNLPTKKLLEAAKQGDYSKLFTLQSDLGKHARQLIKSSSGAERLHGMQAHDLRQRLLDSMKEHLSKRGHLDISELLTEGQKKYAQHMKYVEPAAKKLKKGAAHAVGLGTGYEIFKHLF